ncbi:DUF1292 domain-containing protein [Brevibacillus ginsengisoli]|uniref:DUF1292 domain-containing protein n=1 Tax=Brevibacillus ginsengisoli TaxID=363854 RepID=UPI003CF4D7F1
MTENKGLEVGDVITLDDENGEPIGDFEVLALFDLEGKEYVALTRPLDEEELEEETDEELEIFVLGIEDGELVPLEEDEETKAFAKLDEILEDIEIVGGHDHDHDHEHK